MIAPIDLSLRWQVIHGEAVDVLSHIDPERIGAIVTDPPYGIAFDFARDRRNRSSGLTFSAARKDYTNRGWSNVVGDDKPFDPRPLLCAPHVVIFGAQNFAHLLPPSRGWIVWDKRSGSPSDCHGDAELAWSTMDAPVRLHSQLWRGLVRAGEENVANGPKAHPCQKPVALMGWVLGLLGLAPGALVVDPYCGSSSTGVACVRAGYHFLGIDCDAGCVQTSRDRIGREAAQGTLALGGA